VSRTDTLQISREQSGAVLTPAQKRFNSLIRQIAQTRQTLAAWQEAAPAYRHAQAEVLLPLQAELMAGQRQWVFALDALLDQRSWTKAERETLGELICDAAGELLEARGDDAELKALFDKHAEIDFDSERREVMLAFKDLTEAVTGLDLGDEQEIATEEDLFARMQQRLQDREAAEEAERAAQSVRRRKSAAQQRREAEAQQATQSVREIYRKLASALHPDRETDARQRDEKTALMQRVNQAYAANDLLALLELQLQIEQIDAGHIANASADRLKHYNKVLAEQLAELKAEVDRVEMEFCLEFGLQPDRGLNPRRLGELLEQTSRQWRAELNEQQREMRMLGDVAATRRWLKCQRQRLREADFGFDPF
jgi:hypothetical protein